MMEAHARLSRKAAADAVLSSKQTNTTQVSPAIQDAALLSWKHAHLKKKKRYFELEGCMYFKNALAFIYPTKQQLDISL